MLSREGLTLAILAGGEGSRMGGPKGHLRVGGVPILEFLLDRFEWPGPTMLVTAPGRERPPGHERFSLEASDPVAGHGPLRGVLTAVEHSTTDAVLVATVDMPGLSRPQFDLLVEHAAGRPNIRALLLERGVAGGSIIEPFPSLWRKSAAPFIGARLDAGRRNVHGVLRNDGFAAVAAPNDWDARVWTNLNDPSDVRAFLTTLDSK